MRFFLTMHALYQVKVSGIKYQAEKCAYGTRMVDLEMRVHVQDNTSCVSVCVCVCMCVCVCLCACAHVCV